jgi:hypothetical protein
MSKCSLVECKETKSSEVRTQKLCLKKLQLHFFCAKFATEKQTVNYTFYTDMIKEIDHEFIALGPIFRKVGPSIFHTKMLWCILQVLSPGFGETRDPLLSHSPYSPDLVPADFFYFLT